MCVTEGPAYLRDRGTRRVANRMRTVNPLSNLRTRSLQHFDYLPALDFFIESTGDAMPGVCDTLWYPLQPWRAVLLEVDEWLAVCPRGQIEKQLINPFPFLVPFNGTRI